MLSGPLADFDPYRPIIFDDDAVHSLACADRQIRPSPRWTEIGDGGAAATAVMVCHLIEPGARLPFPIEVRIVGQTIVLTGLDEGFRERMGITLI